MSTDDLILPNVSTAKYENCITFIIKMYTSLSYIASHSHRLDVVFWSLINKVTCYCFLFCSMKYRNVTKCLAIITCSFGLTFLDESYRQNLHVKCLRVRHRFGYFQWEPVMQSFSLVQPVDFMILHCEIEMIINLY